LAVTAAAPLRVNNVPAPAAVGLIVPEIVDVNALAANAETDWLAPLIVTF
jgi:hypothetical protein